LGSDFRWLWAATAVSDLGSAVSSGALPLIAVSVLQVSTLQVALLATLSALAGAALCLPLGAVLDRRRRRPAMIAADLVRCAATASIPFTALVGDLSYPQVCVVGVVNTGATIAFTAASGAHLKTLLPQARWQPATARFESTFWAVNSVGPAIGGVLIGAFGAAASLAADAASFGCSALALARIRRPDPAPTGVAPGLRLSPS
jgi:MFS family permease